jgi:hypothetical protein
MKGFNDAADEVGNNMEKIVGDTAGAIATPVSNEKDFAGFRIPGFGSSILCAASNLLAEVHQSVAALDQSARPTADTVAFGVVIPAGITVTRATPWAIKIISPHGVPR